MGRNPERAKAYERYSEDERHATNVRLVFETIVPYLGYDSMSKEPEFQWGIARKPLERGVDRPFDAPGHAADEPSPWAPQSPAAPAPVVFP
jgi:hypothetical protein